MHLSRTVVTMAPVVCWACKSSPPADTTATPVPSAEVSSIAAKPSADGSDSVMVPSTAHAAMVPAGTPPIDAGPKAAPDDPACAKQTFCDAIRFMTRAVRADVKSCSAAVEGYFQHTCDYRSGPVSVYGCECQRCDVSVKVDVDEAELRRHLKRQGPLAPKTKDLRDSPFEALPPVPLEVRPIVAAVLACLPDFHGMAPDPMPVEDRSDPPYWEPVDPSVPLTRASGGTRQTIFAGWSIGNAEVLQNARDVGVKDQTLWNYHLLFDPPEVDDGGANAAPQGAARDGGPGRPGAER